MKVKLNKRGRYYLLLDHYDGFYNCAEYYYSNKRKAIAWAKKYVKANDNCSAAVYDELTDSDVYKCKNTRLGFAEYKY